MKFPDITDQWFRQAVEAIDAGDEDRLRQLIKFHPQLVTVRLQFGQDGYFKDPYLLWFIADNPIRTGKLPANIVAITRILVDEIRRLAPGTLLEQVNDALALVVTGSTPRKCGLQLELIDLLLDEGAEPGSPLGALAHHNIEAARRLVERGSELSLATAICLGLSEEIQRLAPNATASEKQVALVASAFYGNTPVIEFLLKLGVDVNGYLEKDSGFHAHGSALHQAVSSGSLTAVQALVKAGADLCATDRIYNGTPLEWAEHMMNEADGTSSGQYDSIAKYLAAEMKKWPRNKKFIS